MQGRGPNVELTLEDPLNSKMLIDLVLREGAHAELALEDLVVFLILKAVIPDPELEIFLLHPRCSVQLDR